MVTFIGTLCVLSLSIQPQRLVALGVGVVTGGMLQPASQYYLLHYAAFLEWLSPSQGVGFHVQYWQRPSYSNGPFRDQEQGGFALLLTRLNTDKTYPLQAGLGLGRVLGSFSYTGQPGSTPIDIGQQEGYSINGLGLYASAGIRLSPLVVSLVHYHLVGLVDEDEVRARVAWPFLFTGISLEWEL